MKDYSWKTDFKEFWNNNRCLALKRFMFIYSLSFQANFSKRKLASAKAEEIEINSSESQESQFSCLVTFLFDIRGCQLSGSSFILLAKTSRKWNKIFRTMITRYLLIFLSQFSNDNRPTNRQTWVTNCY